MTMHQRLDDDGGPVITHRIVHPNREGDLSVLEGRHHTNPRAYHTWPTQPGPRIDGDLDADTEVKRVLCLDTRERPGDMWPPTCKRLNQHPGPHQAANQIEWSD